MCINLLNIIANLFGLKVELVTLFKPVGATYWIYSDTKNMVYELYVTNYKNKKQSKSFGFWVYDEKLTKVYKKALLKLIPELKWVIKDKVKSFLKLK